jgi:hypothetical protein
MGFLSPDPVVTMVMASAPVDPAQAARAVTTTNFISIIFFIGRFVALIMLVLGLFWRDALRARSKVLFYTGLICFVVAAIGFSGLTKGLKFSLPRTDANAGPGIIAFRDNSAEMQNIQGIVKTYMWSHAAVPSSIEFRDWSNLSLNGDAWYVDLHYSAVEKTGYHTSASVRFTVRGGAVVNAQVL